MILGDIHKTPSGARSRWTSYHFYVGTKMEVEMPFSNAQRHWDFVIDLEGGEILLISAILRAEFRILQICRYMP